MYTWTHPREDDQYLPEYPEAQEILLPTPLSSQSLGDGPSTSFSFLSFFQQDRSNSFPNLTPFAQFLKEDDGRFYATFPSARPHNWVILGSGGTGFNANHGIYASQTSPFDAPNVLDIIQQPCTAPYHDPVPHTHFPQSFFVHS
ncbi:hypothetical protein GYMLUDRAFT_704019 [Collybiopsis luxurians FD-317 M1]|uniref:Unplaced genomic scaffold GYMLUscaffold_39, whole genome shotgun sequence n=1 Tax=Collybiopsis luxurians FD-317 M1 TaxID=944289 RepID=A0A0D0B444_9AGAR|nr:hypothetical protein GYMLUDRAFT_704019 [Collybiopsis luxurians FD-317 M1]